MLEVRGRFDAAREMLCVSMRGECHNGMTVVVRCCELKLLAEFRVAGNPVALAQVKVKVRHRGGCAGIAGIHRWRNQR